MLHRLDRRMIKSGLPTSNVLAALDPAMPGTFAVMFVVALVAGHLAARLRLQARAAEAARERTQALLDLSQRLQDCTAGADVIAAIQSQNVQAAVGRIGAQPMTADQRFQITLTTQGRLENVAEFEEIVVRANPDGSFVRVKDLGGVELGSKQRDSTSRLNGKPTAAMAIYLAPGANAVAVGEGVQAAMARRRESAWVAVKPAHSIEISITCSWKMGTPSVRPSGAASSSFTYRISRPSRRRCRAFR